MNATGRPFTFAASPLTVGEVLLVNRMRSLGGDGDGGTDDGPLEVVAFLEAALALLVSRCTSGHTLEDFAAIEQGDVFATVLGEAMSAVAAGRALEGMAGSLKALDLDPGRGGAA